MAGAKGRSGRPRKPTHLKVVHGTDRKDRSNPKEPKPSSCIPKPGNHLTPGAREAYFRLAELLDGMKVLTEPDVVALELAAMALDEYYRAKDIVEQKGLTYVEIKEIYDDEDDTVVTKTTVRAHPAVAIASDSWKRASSMLARFGLDPANRSRVSVRPDKPQQSKWNI